MTSMQHILALAALLSCVACGTKEHDVFDGQGRIQRWKVTDEAGVVLSQGCAAFSDQSDGGPPVAGTDYWASRIQVKAAPGTLLIDEDNQGAEEVQKYLVDSKPTPADDEFWCSTEGDTGRGPSPVGGLGCYQIAEQDPPATLEGLELINPAPTDSGGPDAEGFRARLRVQHAGVVHLTRDPATCWGADADSVWTYGAMTIITP